MLCGYMPNSSFSSAANTAYVKKVFKILLTFLFNKNAFLPFINIFILLGQIGPRQKSDGRMSLNNITMFIKKAKTRFY